MYFVRHPEVVQKDISYAVLKLKMQLFFKPFNLFIMKSKFYFGKRTGGVFYS